LFLLGIAVVECSDGKKPIDWWKYSIIYQIYPRSFQDTDGDGVGDIRGIITRLEHFKYLNVDSIWLSPVYKSPMIDHGYDVEDHTDIDPTFGTLSDFDELVSEAHRRGIRVIMDFIPNHVSNKHKWFTESRKGDSSNLYSDFFIWSDGKLLENGTRVPPNNWQSCFTGPAWTWDSVRGQFYYHQFCPEQPDLNYRNPRVREEMKKVLQFWLDRGVDGFRVDAIATMFEVEDLSLNENVGKEGALPHEEFYLDHSYTRSLPEIHEVVREWRQLFDRHYERTGNYVFMMVEVYEPIEKSMKYYSSGADMPLNMWLISATSDCHAACYRKLIEDWLSVMPTGKWPNFVIGNHDRSRVSKRAGKEYVNALNILLLTLPGTPTTYYGEEIGMNEIKVSYEDTQDPWGRRLGPELFEAASRDPCRSPMQWDESLNAGFSKAPKTWLPVNTDYTIVNAKLQKEYPNSPLEVYRRVAQMRMMPAFQTDNIVFLPGTEHIIAYVRYNPVRAVPFLVAINVGPMTATGVGTDAVTISGTEYRHGLLELDSMVGPAGAEGPLLFALNEIKLMRGQAYILQLVVANPRDEL